MFNRRTVFIIGAGCSYEFGLPLGPELSDDICQAVGSGNPGTAQAAVRDAFIRSGDRANENVDSRLQMFANGIHAKQSIDQYLHFHRNDPHTVMLGKCGIAYAILAKERRSKLGINKIMHGLHELRDTWLLKLFHGMNADTDVDTVHRTFRNVGFICFNYDRVIEMALFNAIRMLTCCTISEAAKIMEWLQIWHPYGMVGDAPYACQDDPSDLYGFRQTDPDFGEVLAGARRLRTFMEGMADKDMMNEMRDALATAQQIVFLGFSYLDQNMELLRVQCDDPSKIYAGCYGMSQPDIERAREMIVETFAARTVTPALRKHDITMLNMTAKQVMTDYGNTFRL